MIQIEKKELSRPKKTSLFYKQESKDHDATFVASTFDIDKREKHTILPTIKPVQSEAMNISCSNGILPLFAQDVKTKFNNEKEYLAASYNAIHYYMKNKISKREERNLYELILDNVPCDFFADVDVSLERNPDYKFEEVQKKFIHYVKAQMIEYKYCENETDVEVLILDSTDKTKISRHFIFRLRNGKMFRDVAQCGAFMRNLRNNIQEKEGIEPRKNPFFAWTKRKKEEEWNNQIKALCFIVDMGVYTVHRVFRLLGCTKFRKQSFLRPVDENNTQLGDFETMEYEEFAKYFIQRNARHIGDHPDHIVCLEPDGSDAKSTSDLLIYRPDLNPVFSKKAWKDHYESGDYPFEKIWKWFGHPCREFCFEVIGDSKRKNANNLNPLEWRRHVFFENENAFKSYVMQSVPIAIHIGPICFENSKSEPKERELVFDIDLNEYMDSNQSPIRGCCKKEDKCCDICFELIIIAKTIITDVLKKFMGFKKIKFFFSGRRGMHCWVLDPEIKIISREARISIVNRFLSVKNASKSFEMKSIVQKFKKEYLLNTLKTLEYDIGKQDKDISKYELISLFWPRFDKGPTEQLSHPVKSPFSLHKNTLKIATQLK